MKNQLFCITVLLFAGIVVSVYWALNQRLKKRFRQNPLIQKLVSDMKASMMERIEVNDISDREPVKVIAETATVFEDCIVGQSASLFFHYEHMRLLQSSRARKLMASAIAEELKESVRVEIETQNSVVCSPYQLKSRCRKLSDGNRKAFLAYVSCSVVNERYVCDKPW